MNDFIRSRLLPRYGIAVDAASIAPLGNGHINGTWKVSWPGGALVLQRINTRVFPSPQVLVDNAQKICAHLRRQALVGGYRLAAIEPVLTLEGDAALDLGEQGFWRAMSYLPNSVSLETVENAHQAGQAAAAFGHFTRALSSLDADRLGETIPAFHHLGSRMSVLQEAIEADSHGRVQLCRDWADFVLSQESLLAELDAISPKLPLRICHNDTKLNNMLFDSRDMSSLAIIDLDTCMPGHLLYDFGDMVRSCCSPEAEDSTELERVRVREEIFAALCCGYLGELGEVLTPEERQSLWLGARVMCFMLGVRFLTDYLSGDGYFKVRHEHHNLQRAANQLTLYKNLLANQVRLRAYLD
jgi:Ser/Thr protein kinase RdoA (MazF antagonist)